MFRRMSALVVAVTLLLLPAQVRAGGPARVCLPIDKVTARSAADCSKRIRQFLGKRASDIRMHKHKGQWYATISLRKDISLKAVQDALAGSPFAVRHKNITLIGAAKLSITVRTKFLSGFYRDLEKIDGVVIKESLRDGSGLQVTINSLKSARDLDHATRKLQEYPSYDSIKKLLAGHNADLTDVRWSSKWHCAGVFGCMATPDNKKSKVAKK